MAKKMRKSHRAAFKRYFAEGLSRGEALARAWLFAQQTALRDKWPEGRLKAELEAQLEAADAAYGPEVTS